jgi:hypothetical protein
MSAGADDPEVHAARIEQLLSEVRAAVGPVAWRRVDELVARLVALHGAALGRTLRIVEEAGALDENLRAQLCRDELVGAMLALHGMHPEPLLARARAAGERVRAVIGEAAGTIDMQLDERGALAVTLAGEWRCAVPRAAVEAALRRAIASAAPELDAIVVGGVDFGETPALVQLDLLRSRAALR